MFIGLTGFHGAGKSFLADIMNDKLAWKLINKRDILKEMYGKHYPADNLTWEEWYRALYGKLGAFRVMTMILDEMEKEDDGVPVVLDAVHNTDEWKAIKRICPESILVGVFSPKRVRFFRNNQGDENLDARRLVYWHDSMLGGLSCLLSEIEWAFSGCDSYDLQLRKCYAFRDYLKKIKLI